MTHLQGGINKKSHTTELEIIKQKRIALQKLVKLTGTLNRLHQGLQSIILLGRSAPIPQKIVSKFKSLSKGLKNKPTDTLKNTLSSTNHKIERDIKHVLEISQKSNQLLEQELGVAGSNLAHILKDDYHEHVSNFKKKSQTSITLSIALKERNEVINAFKLPIPESFIKQQIEVLNQNEKKCIKVVKKDMLDLRTDVNSLLAQNNCPEHIKNVLYEIKNELKENSLHIDAGKSIDEMPIMFESIELSEEPKEIKEDKETINETEESLQDTAPIKKKHHFFTHLWLWLNSSWKKKWRDIN